MDWFHITMRQTVMRQMLKGAAAEIPTTAAEDGSDETPNGEDIQEVEKNQESLKWNLWHGNVHRALKVVERLEFDLEAIATAVASADASPEEELRATFREWCPAMDSDRAN